MYSGTRAVPLEDPLYGRSYPWINGRQTSAGQRAGHTAEGPLSRRLSLEKLRM
jgi:hypothetical protein